MAGGSIGVPQKLHDWVLKLLAKIGNTLGVQSALALIPITKLARQRRWLHVLSSRELQPGIEPDPDWDWMNGKRTMEPPQDFGIDYDWQLS